MNKLKILVTGNMGYIGPAVISKLKKSYPDCELIGLDLGFFAHCLTGAEVFPEICLKQQIFADVRNVTTDILTKIIGEVYAVIHLAAISNDPIGNFFEKATDEINNHSSIRLAKIVKELGAKRFIFASSCSVYGSAEGIPKEETHELNPLTPYARSKIAAETGLAELADEDFVITCLRFGTACGMSNRLRLDLVVNDFVAAAISSKEILILSDGSPWRPLIHINDMARAIDWAINRDSNNGGTFLTLNTGSDEWNYQVIDLAECIAKHIPNVKISVNKDALPDKRSYQVSFSKFSKLAPNHQPQIDLSETVCDIKDGLELFDFKDADFRNSNLIRLKVLRDLCKINRLNANLEWV